MCFFFVFKQKTAYDMRISDWSSDVCSSDLGPGRSALQRSQIMDPDAHPRSCRGVWPCAWQWRRRRAYETRRCTGAITNTAQKAGTKTMSVAQLSPNRCMSTRSDEHTSELQSLMRISSSAFCLKKKKHTQ